MKAGQTLNFIITTNNPGLFSVPPAVDAITGTLTFATTSNANGSATITLSLHDNGGIDNGGVDTSLNQTFTIGVASVNQAPVFTKGADQTVLEDSGVTTVSGWATGISPGGGSDEAGQTLNFIVSTNNPGLFSAGPAVNATSGTLTFTPTPNANGVATVTVQLHDDGGTLNNGVDTSPSQTFTITFSPVNDAPIFTKGADQTVLEDSGPKTMTGWAIGISPGGGSDEAGQTLSFIVSTNSPGLFSAGPAVDAHGTLTFTPVPNANGSATVTVQLHDDGGTANGGVDTSPSQTFTITVSPVNDAPTFTKGADQTVLEDSGATSVTGWATGISPGGGSDETGQILNFVVTTNTPGLFSAGPAVDTTSGMLTFTPKANANGSATVTVQLHDDGGTANGGVDTSPSQTFTISITAVNDAPIFTRGADQTVLEDSGPKTVTGWATGISPGGGSFPDSGQTLNFIVSTDSPGLFSAGPTVAANGALTFTPALNANGSATVTVQLHDDGGTDNGGVDTSPSQTFTITITPVNDAPVFTKGADQTVLEDSGLSTVTGWATGISPGGGSDEAGQMLNFIVSTNNPGLFSTGPDVDATSGTLTFTPATNANGSATVTVQLHDDGRTANGGADTSASQTFTINITPVNDPPTWKISPLRTVGIPGSAGFTVPTSDTVPTSATIPSEYTFVGGTEDQPFTITYDQLTALADDLDASDAPAIRAAHPEQSHLVFEITQVVTGQLSVDNADQTGTIPLSDVADTDRQRITIDQPVTSNATRTYATVYWKGDPYANYRRSALMIRVPRSGAFSGKRHSAADHQDLPDSRHQCANPGLDAQWFPFGGLRRQ